MTCDEPGCTGHHRNSGPEATRCPRTIRRNRELRNEYAGTVKGRTRIALAKLRASTRQKEAQL